MKQVAAVKIIEKMNGHRTSTGLQIRVIEVLFVFTVAQ